MGGGAMQGGGCQPRVEFFGGSMTINIRVESFAIPHERKSTAKKVSAFLPYDGGG